ncbi:MAG: hypothetical protein ACR2OG_01970 [Gemmatimonadaceae bacterium]
MGVSSTRSSVGGTAVLMACACGAAGSSVKLIALAGLATTTAFIHPLFLSTGATLVLYGLWRARRQSAGLAAVAFAVLAIAAVITPPSAMTTRGDGMEHGHPGLPWGGLQLIGAVLYLLSGAILALAFWRAYPSPKPAASATAMGGMVLATGCTACCMVTGAIAGMAMTMGVSALYVETMPVVFWTGLAAVAIGLFRLGGWRPVVLVVLGGLVTPAGKIAYELYPAALNLTGLWRVGGVDMAFIPKYFSYFIGAGLILYGFVVAYRRAQMNEAGSADVIPLRKPELERLAIGAD